MAQSGNGLNMPVRSLGEVLQTSSDRMALSISLPTDEQESKLSEDADDAISSITDEDAESLIGPAMSRAATRLKSAKTPVAEKNNALEEGGYFDSDPETPPADSPPTAASEFRTKPERPIAHQSIDYAIPSARQKVELNLGSLPSPKIESSNDLPISPWVPGPKPFIVEPAETRPSSLGLVFGSGTERKRSLSGGAEALKKLLPKGLPSMAQVGNLFSSSSNNTKPRSMSVLSQSSHTRTKSGGSDRSPIPSPKLPLYEEPLRTSLDARPKALRRVTSDGSLLYHTLSRASSLGDDTRWVNQQEQVNSRVKAIRDSLQDRSSFRMPTLPSMPSMPSMPRMPSFSFNMNFLTADNGLPPRPKRETDVIPEILPDTLAKIRPSVLQSSSDGTRGFAVTPPKAVAAMDVAKPIMEGSATTILDRVMETLEGDIVIMGGYRGSILRSAKTHRQVWVPVKVGLNIRKVDLEVGLEPEDEENMENEIYPSGMLQNIGPVDISRRLFKRLTECENAKNGKLRVWDYGYDWRLSPHLLSRKLTAFLEKLECNQRGPDGSISKTRGALVIAHSLGGLVTRHVVNQRPDLFSGAIYAGVPQSCVNILGPIRNGDAVLLSQRVLTAQVNFTLRTSFVLLPEDGGCFVDINDRNKKYPVDFFNLDDWLKYRFSPCTDPPLPPYNSTGGLGSLLSLPGTLLNLPIPGKKSNSSMSLPEEGKDTASHPSKTTRAADLIRQTDGGTDRTLAPQIGNNSNPVSKGQSAQSSVSTAVTIPRDKAIAYLKRTLAETKKFKQELHFRPEHEAANVYPPLALIYGKSIPTCCGAKVNGRESIPCSDVYDNLAFASGDGVCLAKEAMLPEGYKAAYGGRVKSDRGHVTLLGDLNAVGRAIDAVSKGRAKGIGLGMQ